MTNEQTQPAIDDRSEQARTEKQEPSPSQASSTDAPAQRKTPGRKPLFGT